MAKGLPFGNIPGLGNMVKQLQKQMTEDAERIEKELGEARVEATSGGGVVKAVASGKGEIMEIKIEREVVDPDDVEMLEDLVVSAVREALEQAAELRASRMKDLTGGIEIPGLF